MRRFVHRHGRGLALGAAAAVALFALFRALGLGTDTYFFATMSLAFGLALWGASREEAEHPPIDETETPHR